MIRLKFRKLCLSAAAAAIVLGAGAPALAGGGYYGGYHNGYYGNGYYAAGYGGHHGHRSHHRGHGGGKGALIALGVIGGAIILNEAAEARARERAYEARSADRYDRYARRATPAYDADYEARDYQAAPEDGNLSDSDLEPRLDGGPEPIRLTYADAYRACTKHARAALGNRGFILAAPAEPETAEDVGGAWKMTATVTAQKGDDRWSRAMYCEADDSRVYLLELI